MDDVHQCLLFYSFFGVLCPLSLIISDKSNSMHAIVVFKRILIQFLIAFLMGERSIRFYLWDLYAGNMR